METFRGGWIITILRSPYSDASAVSRNEAAGTLFSWQNSQQLAIGRCASTLEKKSLISNNTPIEFRKAPILIFYQRMQLSTSFRGYIAPEAAATAGNWSGKSAGPVIIIETFACHSRSCSVLCLLAQHSIEPLLARNDDFPGGSYGGLDHTTLSLSEHQAPQDEKLAGQKTRTPHVALKRVRPSVLIICTSSAFPAALRSYG
ncbi:hypothetical protein BJV78DRAFT_833469 [Lactifluus subvellereus]|nr:hypothetical protein BJV78DRAFT_833469 [Lactifluus subvellereus]